MYEEQHQNNEMKETLLSRIHAGLEAGILSAQDLHEILSSEEKHAAFGSSGPDTGNSPNELNRSAQALPAVERVGPRSLSLVDVLYYLAGGIFYGALMVMALQVGNNSPTVRTSIMLMSGACIWTLVYLLGRRKGYAPEKRKGLIDGLLLSGCLAVVSGGVMAAVQVAVDAPYSFGYALAGVGFVLGAAHLLFDRLFRHVMLVVFGMFLLVGAFPSMLGSLLVGHHMPIDVWALIGMCTGVLLAWAGTLAARTAPERGYLRTSFFSFAGFLVLSAAYGASLGSKAAALWCVVLPLLIYTALYRSITMKSQEFLVIGSIFLVFFIITVSFKYFSGFGAAFSLLISATALLGTAFMATSINKKYIQTGLQ